MKHLIKGLTAWNFRANESNQVYLNCRVQPKISKKGHSAAIVTGYAVPGQGDGGKVLPLGSTPVAMDVLWRSAFQARRPHNA